MVFGIKRKRDNPSDSFREDGGTSEKKSFQELNKDQDKIFGTWKEDKNSQSNDSDTWEEDN